ncbi:MAG: VCBS repeat-containing protein, partial [Planctomycetia bacterium]|nr:VCBS repeat-containing protein [Planctomycetia bacterium]
QFAVGTGSGGSQAVRFFNPDRTERFIAPAFPGLTGGVRTASGDFNGDGVADVVIGTGPGSITQVQVLDGNTGAELFRMQPFESAFTGGVYVATGDLTGDGTMDLVITPDEGGGPRARIFSGKGFTQIADFFVIDDPAFRGGARAAIGDVNGDGRADLVASAGFGGGPRIAGYDGKSVGVNPQRLFQDFFLFEDTLRNGAFIAVGDIDGDGFADIVGGGGPGGGPRVLGLSGKSLLTNAYITRANFFAGDLADRGGIRVAIKNLDGDNRADIIVGSGDGSGNRVTGFLGANILPDGTPLAAFNLDSFPGFAGGVFVG